MKKVWIVLLILLAVCVLAAGAWYFIFSPWAAKVQYIDDVDSLYRYGYLENKDGFQFVIEGETQERQSWEASADSAGMVLLKEKENEKEENRHSFFVQGLQAGTTRLLFTLQEGSGSMANRFYQLWADINVLENGKIQVRAGGHKALQPALSGGNDEYMYLLSEQSDAGKVTLRLNKFIENAWKWQIDGELVTVTQTRPAMDEVLYELAPIKNGEATLTVYSNVKKRAVTVSLLAEENALRVVSHACSEEAFTPRETVKGQDAFEQTYGRCVLPEGAQLYSVGEQKLWCMTQETGWMQFKMDGQRWELYLHDTEKFFDLAAPMLEGSEELSRISVSGKTVKVYQYVQRTFAFWENAEGRSYLLMGECTEQSAFEKVLEAMWKVTVNG